MTALGIESASKHYDNATALDAVSLQFPDGATTAVSGQVRVFGEPIDYATLPLLRRRLGYAVQGNVLFPHLTARENITLLAKLEGWDTARIDDRVDELMSLSQLGAEQLDRYPHQLSGGQQQRVGLCRAMMLRPEILLLDEPFGAIDPITREDIQQQFLVLQQAEPRTSVLVTHDMREALVLAQHIVVMGGGRVLLSEPRDALLRRHPDADATILLREVLSGAPS